MDDREVEVEVAHQGYPMMELIQPPQEIEGTDINFTEMLQDMLPKRKKRRTVKVPEARRVLVDEELKKLVDMDDVVNESLDRVENHGIIFIDEIDKIAGERGQGGGPDVSREGVQRDLLPIVEGSTVQTRYGYVRSDHILFIAAGAFHVSKPSDLIPELQGRFPIRVELQPLTEQDFVRIMTEPENALTKQYGALIESEGAKLEFSEDGIAEIARVAAVVNERMENIGARRLHTVMTTLLEDVMFELPDRGTDTIKIDAGVVRIEGAEDIHSFVEAQLRTPNSLLRWMQRFIALRKEHPVFGLGDYKPLRGDNSRVFVHLRTWEDDTLVCVHNLARSAQAVQLDLSDFAGRVPVEMLGQTAFPAIGGTFLVVFVGVFLALVVEYPVRCVRAKTHWSRGRAGTMTGGLRCECWP